MLLDSVFCFDHLPDSFCSATPAFFSPALKSLPRTFLHYLCIIIPNVVLYISKESILKAALTSIVELRYHHLPMLRAADFNELRLAHETANIIVNAKMKLKASLMRKEGRYCHYSLDYPEVDNENRQAWINIYKGSDSEMKSEKQTSGPGLHSF